MHSSTATVEPPHYRRETTRKTSRTGAGTYSRSMEWPLPETSGVEAFDLAKIPYFERLDKSFGWGVIDLFPSSGSVASTSGLAAERSDQFHQLRIAISTLAKIELADDTSFDKQVIAGARLALNAMDEGVVDPPKVTWQGNDTIVFTWRFGARVDALVVTESEALLLVDGEFNRDLPPVPINDRPALDMLLLRVGA